ncbi:MAG TPA: hypothetical protein VKR27_03525, partial [Acidimicrobiales bacterium]|nr:hypothetical protein [Acidimicrobiales bacterium]
HPDEARWTELDSQLFAHLAAQRLLASLAEFNSAAKESLKADANRLVPAIRNENLIRPRSPYQGEGNDSRLALRHSLIMTVHAGLAVTSSSASSVRRWGAKAGYG